ncbi:MAG: radical SAM protein, partial [Candidatus Aminicenantes bacterium]|nr:radical SAM protein [Candidatus Aminicenantes bacterium]
MAGIKDRLALVGALAGVPEILRVKPSIVVFLCRYMRKFRTRVVGGRVILHSHLPPLNGPAYRRFVREHLIARVEGPSHAQVGLTNACPQSCAYCYNRGRTGRPMDTATILGVVRDLRALGVVWMGWTGGEPLLNRDIVRITESAARDCAVKLFTTGSGLTPELARDLSQAGLFSVSVSLDDPREREHDRCRGRKGAYREALKAIETFRSVAGLHVGVSSVLSRDSIRRGGAEELLAFLETLGVHEAWISEAKPSLPRFWSDDLVIGEEDRLRLVRLQDEYNKNPKAKLTVNYLGHFEGREHFGCNAGRKMVYVDAFGEVSPCVFTPFSLGNVRTQPLAETVAAMNRRFPSEESCFMNRNFGLLAAASRGRVPL